MVPIFLGEQQRKRLSDAFQTSDDPRLRLRSQAVLMASRGRRPEQLAEDLCVSVRTVQRWLHAFVLRGPTQTMEPTLVRTLGVKGHRPTVGTWDNKDKLYAVASVNCITGKLTTRLVQSRTAQRRKKTQSHNQRMPHAFARPLRDVGRVHPANHFPQVVAPIDNAPWHRGPRVEQALAQVPPVQLDRLPSYSPRLNPVQRLWTLLRQRATHNRLFLANSYSDSGRWPNLRWPVFSVQARPW